MNSKFSGNAINSFGVNVVCLLTIIFSLGFALPWAVCRKEKWYAEHTIIDGKQMVFDGTGKELFKKTIGWVLLSIITLGICSIWSSLKIRKWVILHTHFAKISK